MQSTFNPSDNHQLIERVNQLTPSSQPLWGKLNVVQMLAHLQKPIEVATGQLTLRHTIIGKLFGKMAKKKLMKEGNFSRNLPTAPEFLIADPESFENEKNKVIRLVKKLEEQGASGITKDAHPFFGKMTTEEWDLLQWKHLDHHLRQFGV
ncbi:hypothetical protein BH11BAC2_BH11BAC2_11170 [soil metagenome]